MSINLKTGLKVWQKIILILFLGIVFIFKIPSEINADTQCAGQVFLTVEYINVNCREGNNKCLAKGDAGKVTAVGWKNGKPLKIYGNSVKIPLTNIHGVWLRDTAFQRSSSLIKGLGLMRMGDGRVFISHAQPYNPTTGRPTDSYHQYINAKFTLTGATVKNFTNGIIKAIKDVPKNKEGNPVKCNLEKQGDNNYSKSTDDKPWWPGDDEVKWQVGSSTWTHYTRAMFPGDDYTIKLQCPPDTNRCVKVNAYNNTTDWKLMSASDLSKLKPGDTVVLFVRGEKNSGTFDKARFNINNEGWKVTKDVRPNTLQYYTVYTIPNSSQSGDTISVKAQIHHKQRNRWY